MTVFKCFFHHVSDIVQLTAEPDFKSVTLRWEYARSVPILYGFQINYCEMQAWGPNRCRSKVCISDPTQLPWLFAPDELRPVQLNKLITSLSRERNEIVFNSIEFLSDKNKARNKKITFASVRWWLALSAPTATAREDYNGKATLSRSVKNLIKI